jgi:hypothetical protein
MTLVGIIQALWEALHAGKVSHFLLKEEIQFFMICVIMVFILRLFSEKLLNSLE